MADAINEATVETAALSWFADLGYEVRHGEDIAPGEPARSVTPTTKWCCWAGSAMPSNA